MSLISPMLWARQPIFQEGRYKVYFNPQTETYRVESKGFPIFSQAVKDAEDLESFFSQYEQDAGKVPARLRHLVTRQLHHGLKSPTPKQLLGTAEDLKAEAMAQVDQNPSEEDCHNTTEAVPPKEEVKTEEYFCVCELPQEIQASLKEAEGEEQVIPFEPKPFTFRQRLIGDLVYEEYDFETGNDNFFHGLLQAIDGDDDNDTGPKKFDGNDRGRTVTFGTHYKAIGTDGEFRMGLASTLWGTLSLDPDGRSEKNADGSVKQYSLERDELDLSLRRRFFGKRENYVISGFRYEYETDDGFLSQKAQAGWHDLFKSQGQVIYDNQDFRKDNHTFTVYGGLGREWVSNLGNWKCRAVAEGIVGAGHSLRTGGELEVGGRGEFHLNSGKAGGRSEDNAWFALSVWGESLYNTQDATSTSAGLEFSTSMKAGEWRVKPYVGFQYHDSANDDFFGAHEGDANEVYHSLGVRITRSIGGK